MPRSATTSILAARWLALALALGPGAGAAQERLELSLPQARALAADALVSGDEALAREIVLPILAANPDDRDALVILASADLPLGLAAEGRQAAVRAWRLSETRAERYEAARLVAAAALAEGRPFLAELWLRLALVTAPGEAEAERTEAQARALRALNPWRVDVELGFEPSDNVNGGSESPFSIIEGLPFVGIISVDGRALSGWTGTADLTVTRRLTESPRQRTQLAFRLGGRGVLLSQEARDLIDEATDEDGREVTGEDFSSAYADLEVRHDRIAGPFVLGSALSAGQTWYGGEPLFRSLRLSGSAARPLGDAQALRFAGSAEQRWEIEGDGTEVRLGVEAGWSRRIGEAQRLSFAISRGATLSDNGNAASTSWGARASYAPGRSLGPARLEFLVGASWTDYADYAVIFPVPGGRQDERVFGRIEAAFDDWSLGGFAPVVSFEASRSDSNVSRFDTEAVGLGVTLRSTF